MSGLWTTQQRDWLQAMGHQVLALTSAQTADVPAVENEVPAPVRAGPPSIDRDRTPSRPSRPPAASAGDRLMQALLRAAGTHVEAAVVIALVPDTAQLRGNAAAKRALWPRLRALRRGRPV